ncbi:MAG: hypothetical protein AAF889_11480 [Cyanobacteria bacterium P01_D01_bin.73]
MPIPIEPSERATILMELRKDRLSQADKIRDRAYQVLTSTIGLCSLVVGYLVQMKGEVGISQRVVLLLTFFIIFSIVGFYISELERGLVNQFKILARLESLLGFYDAETFDLPESIFPVQWLKSPGQGKYFNFIKYSLASIAIFTCIAVLAKDVLF